MPIGDDERQDNKPPATTGAPPASNDNRADSQASVGDELQDSKPPAMTGAPSASNDDTADTRASGGARAASDPGAEQMTSAIGRQLKENYGKLLREPVPQKFLDLLDELEAKTRNRSRSSDNRDGGA